MFAERIAVFAFAAVALVAATGCAGARTTVAADRAEYPLSLSPAVRDADGTIVSGADLERVATFQAKVTAFGMLYSAIRLNPRTDISKQVNEQIARAGGEAIVNLKIMSDQCGANFAAIIDAIPIWPGCAKVVVEGDIVKVKRNRAAKPSSPAVATPSRIASATIERQP